MGEPIEELVDAPQGNIAKDLFSAFDAGDLFAPDVARRYRDTVLAAGGSRDAADLVEEFLGRPYDNRAFTAWLES